MILVPLVALALIAPLLVFYFWFLNWIDRFEKEPFWLQCLAFLYGAVAATVLGALLTGGLSAVTADQVIAYAGTADEVDKWATWLFAPIAEESTKGAGVILFFVFGHLVFREFDGPMDGVVYGGLIGLGFTATEDVLYMTGGAAHAGPAGLFALAILRTVFSGLAHACYTSMTGLGWGLAATTRNPLLKIAYPTGGFALAILLHGVHNWLPTYYGQLGGVMSILANWAFFLLWFVLIIALIGGERRIVVERLSDEVARDELHALSSVFAQGWSNLKLLFTGLRDYSLARRRQHLLIELAFLKDKLARGIGDAGELAAAEREVRRQLHINAEAAFTRP